jgi:hypothetical protein
MCSFGFQLSAVIASAAKQSISPRKERVDCFVAGAPLRKRFAFVAGNDVDKRPHSRGAFRPSYA